jgi:uncharacterized coiled-coil protein SlyX
MPRSQAVPWVRGVREKLKRVVRNRRPQAAGRDSKVRSDQEALAKRLEAVERRLAHLESMVEGLQDSVHRESVRQGKLIDQLQRKAEPSAIRRALGRDAEEHGL